MQGQTTERGTDPNLDAQRLTLMVARPNQSLAACHNARVLKPPEPDPSLAPFRGGVAVLLRDGEVAGHAATHVSTFWAPLSFSLRRQWWVWMIIVWADGDRERTEEDYPPWTYVREMQSGMLSWEQGVHRGNYVAEWLPEDQREQMLSALRIRPEDF